VAEGDANAGLGLCGEAQDEASAPELKWLMPGSDGLIWVEFAPLTAMRAAPIPPPI
jgi:hypothetical protein